MTSRLQQAGIVLLAMSFAVALLPPQAQGQRADPRKPYSLIFGTVFAADGRPAAGVKIKIRRADQKKAKWELVSDRRGEFAQRFPAGKADYIVWADLKDTQAAEKTAVTVHMENDERQDISLHLNQ